MAPARPDGLLAVRFHLAPGVDGAARSGEAIVRLVLPKGAVWSFLWEGADLHEEDSVRQSTHIGFHKTRQLVLEADGEGRGGDRLDFHVGAGVGIGVSEGRGCRSHDPLPALPQGGGT